MVAWMIYDATHDARSHAPAVFYGHTGQLWVLPQQRLLLSGHLQFPQVICQGLLRDLTRDAPFIFYGRTGQNEGPSRRRLPLLGIICSFWRHAWNFFAYFLCGTSNCRETLLYSEWLYRPDRGTDPQPGLPLLEVHLLMSRFRLSDV